MSPTLTTNTSETSVIHEETDAIYTIEVIAELAGTEPQMILHYQEMGLLQPAKETAFDNENLRRLRRIEHLRHTCEMNTTGLKLMLHLLDEVERLQQERRRWQW